MKCIKCPWWAIFALTIGLSGCSSQPDIPPVDSEQSVDVVETVSETASETASDPAASSAPATAGEIDTNQSSGEQVGADSAIATGAVAGQAGAAVATEVVVEEQAPQVLPNPYLQNGRTVSEAVKQQFSTAQAAIEQENWSQAEQVWRQIVEQNPDYSGAWFNLSILFSRQQEWPKALDFAQKAVAANGDNVAAFNQMGIILRQQGKFEDAEQAYQKALKRWPDYADAHRNVGILYDLYMGQAQKALEHYTYYQALQTEPDKRVRGWIKDLQRRVAAMESAQ